MILNIGFLVFPKLQMLGLAGPFDAFWSLTDQPAHLIWKNTDPVRTTCGWALAPSATFQDCPPLDVFCIPGGIGVNALMKDPEVLAFVRAQAARSRMVTSVCTGALVLGAAGLLKGRKATTHWGSMNFLPTFGAEPITARTVIDGNYVTSQGVTAGIDFALEVMAMLAGRQQAEGVQLKIEYAPAPPFDAGNQHTAPAEVVAKIRAESESYLVERRAIVAGWLAKNHDQ